MVVVVQRCQWHRGRALGAESWNPCGDSDTSEHEVGNSSSAAPGDGLARRSLLESLPSVANREKGFKPKTEDFHWTLAEKLFHLKDSVLLFLQNLTTTLYCLA